MSKLEGVEATMYIPLAARIIVSERFPDYFCDRKAMSLKRDMPFDSIAESTTEYFAMAGAARFHELDKIVTEFIRKNPECNVVNLGCGLETCYYRISPPETVKFYEVDLPGVIEQRKRALGSEDNDILVSGDMFTLNWTKKIDMSKPTLVTVIGVFQYFEEQKVAEFLRDLKDRACDCTVVFDAMSSGAMKAANKFVRKTGNSGAEILFSTDDPEEFARSAGYTLIDSVPFFKDARTQLKWKLTLYTRIAMRLVDEGSKRSALYVLE